jgi:polysaccharide biosynthesis transport protein
MLPGENYSADPVNSANMGNSPSGMGRFLIFLRLYWWVPLVTLLLAIGGGIAIILLAAPVYTSSASMWETERLHLSEGAIFSEDASTYIGTQIELLKSGRMAQETLEDMRTASTNGLPKDKDGLPLRVTLNFREAPKSTVFVITTTSADPAFSQNYLDALMADYLKYKKEVRKSVSGATAASIEGEVEAGETELKSDQDALLAFERTNNLAILQEEGTVAGNHLETLQGRLSDLQLQSQLLQASAREEKTNSFEIDGGIRSPIDLVKNPGLPGAPTVDHTQLSPAQQVAFLKAQRAEQSKTYKPAHPKIMALDMEIAHGEKIVELMRTQSRDQLRASEKAVEMNITNVQASIEEWKSKVTESSERIADANHLRQNVSRSQSKYDRLKNMLENVDITRNTDMETLHTLEPASPAKRSYPHVFTAGVLAFAGLGLGLGIVFLIEKRDDRFTSLHDVHFAVGDAVVGQVPELARNGKAHIGLLEVDDTRHSYAESYRNLRSALLFLATDGERPKVLLVTSAMPGEGKSTVAANLTRALSLSGANVLLVDGDLRKGSLHQALHMQSEPGLAELLRRACEPEKVVQQHSLPNFAFVSRGSHTSNPGDLFLGSDLDEALARWRKDFDFVVIDSSPVFAADDASCLAPKADGTLFVVRRGHSSAGAVNEALNLLAQRQAKLLGVIFNGADGKARNYHFYKDEGYKTSARTA